MRQWTVTIVAIALTGFALAYAQDEAVNAKPDPIKGLESVEQRISYLTGYSLGREMRQRTGGASSFNFDEKSLMQGVTDAMKGDQPQLSQEQIKEAFKQFEIDLAKGIEKRSVGNVVEGKKFLEENGKKPNVKTTDSGLQYEVVKEGNGNSPSATDTVTVHYEGKLLDGTVFDSSYKRHEPTTFPLSRVIPGWTEGLQLMKEGGVYMLYVPSNLAYKDSPQGPGGPNSTLIFKVELIKVNE